MPVPSTTFRGEDVYIDFPQEDVMFRYVGETGVIFRKFYGAKDEDEVPHSSALFNESLSLGKVTTAAAYDAGKGASE